MNIRRWLFLAFLLLTTLPLTVVGYVGVAAIKRVSELTVADSAQRMKELGQASIRQKALDVAKQAQLYFEAHPGLLSDPAKMMADKELAGIAVQPVGETGYTALYNSKGITYFHSNPKLIGKDMRMFAATRPEFWAIFNASLDGTAAVGSYYIWTEPDGSLREKYMECVPVVGTPFRIAATTYIDEFNAPIRATRQKAQVVIEATSMQILAVFAFVTGMALLVAFGLSSYISHPVEALISASKSIEAGDFSSVNLRDVEKRQDELGGLARIFSKMVQQVERRELGLKQEVQDLQVKVNLLIEIDETRRKSQVQEITETKYFEELKRKAAELRRDKKSKRTGIA
jgi:methyl-accepting chemotaxis protein